MRKQLKASDGPTRRGEGPLAQPATRVGNGRKALKDDCQHCSECGTFGKTRAAENPSKDGDGKYCDACWATYDTRRTTEIAPPRPQEEPRPFASFHKHQQLLAEKDRIVDDCRRTVADKRAVVLAMEAEVTRVAAIVAERIDTVAQRTEQCTERTGLAGTAILPAEAGSVQLAMHELELVKQHLSNLTGLIRREKDVNEVLHFLESSERESSSFHAFATHQALLLRDNERQITILEHAQTDLARAKADLAEAKAVLDRARAEAKADLDRAEARLARAKADLAEAKMDVRDAEAERRACEDAMHEEMADLENRVSSSGRSSEKSSTPSKPDGVDQCAVCGTTENLSWAHIVPSRITLVRHGLGSDQKDRNYIRLCGHLNRRRSGDLGWSMTGMSCRHLFDSNELHFMCTDGEVSTASDACVAEDAKWIAFTTAGYVRYPVLLRTRPHRTIFTCRSNRVMKRMKDLRGLILTKIRALQNVEEEGRGVTPDDIQAWLSATTPPRAHW